MFGISFTELAVILVVALIVVGPQKLPAMLSTVGTWIRKVRKITAEVRQQTGIDEILRQEGLHGGLNELRSMLRVDFARSPYGMSGPTPLAPSANPYAHSSADNPVFDPLREYPPEGVDAFGALADDLVADDTPEAAEGAAGTASALGATPTETAPGAAPAVTDDVAGSGAAPVVSSALGPDALAKGSAS